MHFHYIQTHFKSQRLLNFIFYYIYQSIVLGYKLNIISTFQAICHFIFDFSPEIMSFCLIFGIGIFTTKPSIGKFYCLSLKQNYKNLQFSYRYCAVTDATTQSLGNRWKFKMQLVLIAFRHLAS